MERYKENSIFVDNEKFPDLGFGIAPAESERFSGTKKLEWLA